MATVAMWGPQLLGGGIISHVARRLAKRGGGGLAATSPTKAPVAVDEGEKTAWWIGVAAAVAVTRGRRRWQMAKIVAVAKAACATAARTPT